MDQAGASPNEKLVEAFEGYLRYVRRRWTALILVSVVGLIADLAAVEKPSVRNIPPDAGALADVAVQSDIAGAIHADPFGSWLNEQRIDEIDRIADAIVRVGRQISATGRDARSFEFFSIHPASVGHYRDAASAMREALPPKDIRRWDASQLRDMSVLLSPQALEPHLRRDIDEVRADTEALLRSDLSGDLTNALAALRTDLDRLDRVIAEIAPYPATGMADQDTVGKQLLQLSDLMYKTGFNYVGPLTDATAAERISENLESGSVSVLDFHIPGGILQLVLPWLAVALAFEMCSCLAQARAWSDDRFAGSARADIVSLFPWLPGTIVLRSSASSTDRMLMSGIAVAAMIAPTALLFPLVLGSEGTVFVASICALVLLTWLSLVSLSRFRRLGRATSANTRPSDALEAPEVVSLRQHLNRAATTWTASMTVSTTVSLFFLVIVFVPPELMGNREELALAHRTRDSLAQVYQQRFHDHYEDFAKWCQTACDEFEAVTIVDLQFGDGHPLVSDVKAFVGQEPLHSYAFAVGAVRDLVLESRARFPNLDLGDAKDAIELLYRDSLEPFAMRATQLSRKIATAPPETTDYLPSFLKSPPPSDNMTVPVPYPYRKYVERDGFVTNLIPLPPRGDAAHFVEFAERRGFVTMAAFDTYVSAFNRFDEAIGLIKLRIAGIDVDRGVAGRVASVAISAIMWLLLVRLFVARRLIQRYAADGYTKRSIVGLPGAMFVVRFRHGRLENLARAFRSGMLIAWPLAVQALVVVSAHIAPEPISGWTLISSSLTLLAAGVIIRERKLVLA